jgi:hypothetical protein
MIGIGAVVAYMHGHVELWLFLGVGFKFVFEVVFLCSLFCARKPSSFLFAFSFFSLIFSSARLQVVVPFALTFLKLFITRFNRSTVPYVITYHTPVHVSRMTQFLSGYIFGIGWVGDISGLWRKHIKKQD